MPNFKEFIKGFEEKPEPQKSQRDLDTEEHNKIIAQINAKAPKMKHEDYKAEIAKEDARFNSVQDKWEDEPKPQEDKTKVTKGIVDFDNKQDFLEKNNWAKDFAWQGNDLIDRKTNEKVYTLSKEGAQVPVIADEIIKHKGKQPKTKYEGGFAKDMQDAGFEPYGVDERNQILRVKDAQGADYEISQGEDYSYNVYKDGKKIYENVPNYMRFDTVVAGKPEAGFERYQAQDDISAPAAQPKQGSFEETFEGEEDSEEAARQNARDLIMSNGIEGFDEDFQEWVWNNALDENGLENLRQEYVDYFNEVNQPDDAKWIANTSEEDLLAFIRNSFPDTWQKELYHSNAINLDEAAEEAVSRYGVPRFLGEGD